jgi:hypothetical protein
MALCPWTSPKGRKCKLELKQDGSPHEGQHRTALRNKPIPEGVKLQRVKVPSADIAPATKGSGGAFRDDEQKAIDRDIALSYDEWKRRGKPSPSDFFNSSAADNFTYVVPPTAVDAVLDAMRRGVGAGAEMAGKSFRYRMGVHKSGNTAIRFVAIDPVEKKKDDDKK